MSQQQQEVTNSQPTIVQALTEQVTKEKRFRFQGQCVLLTYAAHVDINAEFDKWDKAKGMQWARGVHEVGATGHNHTHLLIEFCRKMDTINPRYFDIKEGDVVHHPNIRKVIGLKHKFNTWVYLEKQGQPIDRGMGPVVGSSWQWHRATRE